METNKIMHADILDILFEGRNKEYGAYDLRKTYNRRIVKSMLVTGAVILLLFIGYFGSGRSNGTKMHSYVIADDSLINVKEEKVVVVPPPPKVEVPKVEIKQFTPPKIVKDEQVKPDEKPPENDKLDDVKIGTVNQEGVKDDGVTAPPASDGGKGVVEA